MTAAHRILARSNSSIKAKQLAEELTEDITHNYLEETTKYVFYDESVLVVSGSNVSAYSSIEE
jgi:hypothetical protein